MSHLTVAECDISQHRIQILILHFIIAECQADTTFLLYPSLDHPLAKLNAMYHDEETIGKISSEGGASSR